MTWDQLPPDVSLEILKMRRCMRRRAFASTHIQSRWRAHRTRTLVYRFELLRCLFPFRTYRPSVLTFLQRVRL